MNARIRYERREQTFCQRAQACTRYLAPEQDLVEHFPAVDGTKSVIERK